MDVSVLKEEHAELSSEVHARQRTLEIIALKTNQLLEQQGLVDSIAVLQNLRLDLTMQLEEMEAMKTDALNALAAAKVACNRCRLSARLPLTDGIPVAPNLLALPERPCSAHAL